MHARVNHPILGALDRGRLTVAGKICQWQAGESIHPFSRAGRGLS
jgi:hypothetical protein